ncbi:MAG: RRXRR domain-containing protein [Candidatus Hodarchaeales archaeon]
MSVSVMVLNMRGQPLMPTTPQKARRSLKEKKAKVIQRLPFMIHLMYATGENKRDIELDQYFLNAFIQNCIKAFWVF